MKVKLLDISEEGLNINNTIPLAGLSARLNQGGKSDIEFLSDPKLDITIFKKPSGADMSGTATATYHQSCGRCLDRIERVAEVRVDLELVPKPEGARPGDPAYEDDIGIIFYEDDEIDLAEIVHEIDDAD